MENNETTTPETPQAEAPAPETPQTEARAPEAPAPEAPAPEPPADPSVIGRLTPEEQQGMMRIRAESQQILAKIGEYDLLKSRLLARVEELDSQGQAMIAGVTKRLGLPEGSNWVGTQDGTIRLVNRDQSGQTQQGGNGASS